MDFKNFKIEKQVNPITETAVIGEPVFAKIKQTKGKQEPVLYKQVFQSCDGKCQNRTLFNIIGNLIQCTVCDYSYKI